MVPTALDKFAAPPAEVGILAEASAGVQVWSGI